jgi:hypothetical protein
MKPELVFPGSVLTDELARDVPEYVSNTLEQYTDYVRSAADQVTGVLDRLRSSLSSAAQDIAKLESAINSFLLSSSTSHLFTITEELSSPESTQSSTLYLDTTVAGLTLKPAEMENLNSRIVDIREYGNGIPGNNMVVESIYRPVSGDENPSVKLVGESDNHAVLLQCLDGSEDTWFEWESVVIPPQQPAVQVGRAWIYGGSNLIDVRQVTNNLDWTVDVFHPGSEKPVENVPLATFAPAPDDTMLARLTLVFAVDEVRDNVFLDIVPYTIAGIPIILESVETSTDGTTWNKLDIRPGLRIMETYTLSKAVRIALNRFSWIRITLKAGGWYSPRKGLGHMFGAVLVHERFQQKFLGFKLKDERRQWWQRVSIGKRGIGTIVTKENDVLKIVGAVVGAAYAAAGGLAGTSIATAVSSLLGSAAAALAAPVTIVLGAILGSWLASNIFSEKKERWIVKEETGIDVFDGWRSAIGIREIRMVQATYASSGYWISRPYRFPTAVKSIRLLASDSVPDGAEVSYHISTDGTTWLPAQKGVELPLDKPSSSVMVRIDMSSTDKYASPVVFGFELEGRV